MRNIDYFDIKKKKRKRSIFMPVEFNEFSSMISNAIQIPRWKHLAEYSLDWSQGSIKACNKRSNESDELVSQA